MYNSEIIERLNKIADSVEIERYIVELIQDLIKDIKNN